MGIDIFVCLKLGGRETLKTGFTLILCTSAEGLIVRPGVVLHAFCEAQFHVCVYGKLKVRLVFENELNSCFSQHLLKCNQNYTAFHDHILKTFIQDPARMLFPAI